MEVKAELLWCGLTSSVFSRSIIVTAFLGTSVIFICFTLSALYAKRRSYLFLGGERWFMFKTPPNNVHFWIILPKNATLHLSFPLAVRNPDVRPVHPLPVLCDEHVLWLSDAVQGNSENIQTFLRLVLLIICVIRDSNSQWKHRGCKQLNAPPVLHSQAGAFWRHDGSESELWASVFEPHLLSCHAGSCRPGLVEWSECEVELQKGQEKKKNTGQKRKFNQRCPILMDSEAAFKVQFESLMTKVSVRAETIVWLMNSETHFSVLWISNYSFSYKKCSFCWIYVNTFYFWVPLIQKHVLR